MSIKEKFSQSYLIKNLVYILVFLILSFLLVLVGLRLYTSHGQKLSLPNFETINIEEARKIADKSDFEIIIDDSVHIVGKEGGEILSQNPKANAPVKNGRKVYVTIAKYNADIFLSSQLPPLYGRKFDLKQRELKTQFKLNCKVESYAYDPGPMDHILEVKYQGKSIENRKGKNKNVKIAFGEELEFVLSKRDGGQIVVPDLVCSTLEGAEFVCQSSRVSIGDVVDKEGLSEQKNAYVYAQEPAADGVLTMPMGSSIKVYIKSTKPDNCEYN